jgi:hypothetical protein
VHLDAALRGRASLVVGDAVTERATRSGTLHRAVIELERFTASLG